MEEEIISVRALRDFKRFGETANDGDVIEMPRREAIDRVLKRDVEPDGCATGYFPSIPPGGCTLDEAVSLHLRSYPCLGPLLDRLKTTYKEGLIFVHRYRVEATWGGIPLDAAHDPRYRNSPRVWNTREGSSVKYLKVPLESLDSRFDNALCKYLVRVAICSFITLLKEEKLIAQGVAEADRTTFERCPIPVELFDENVSLNPSKGEIWEESYSSSNKRERLWSRVKVFKAIDPDPEERKGPGRPLKSRELWEKEFLRRCKEGERLGMVAQQAKSLREWLMKTHPDAEVPDEKTISNRLSAEFSAEFPKE